MNYIPKKMILTAGPMRSNNDTRYVLDAVRNGWNWHHSDYIEKFQTAFAHYLGKKHAIAMPTGTSALHLALVLCGIQPGDEVIIPDMTYIACANVVNYLGAKPVFADIDSQTWSIDSSLLDSLITKRTKAIMPVHLYGNMANMPDIMKIARKYGLFVIEDACEGIGCKLNGQKCGTFGDASAFSFQGAKLIAIGEGGMLVTDNSQWYERALSLVDHGIDFTHQFWHKEIGYMYSISNIQAALGLARLETIQELINHKRKIFSWYRKRLETIPGISINPSRDGLFSSYWMSSVVLEKKFRLSRDEIRRELKKQNIDTRPFFYPISEFGLYSKPRFETKESKRIAHNGINLPSGVLLKEEQVDYITHTLRQILAT